MTTQGFHSISAEKYHQDPCIVPSLSSSIAQMLLRESPRKAWFCHPRLNPDYREEHESKFELGTAAHAVLLENDASKIVIIEADDWRKKAAKEQREAARAAGKTPLLAHHYDRVRKMVDAALAFIKESEIAEEWNTAESEVTGIWKEGDIWLRCRFDKITKDRRAVLDFKTTDSSVEPDAFSRFLVRMGYHWQSSFYLRGARALGAETPKFILLAQSAEPPYECTLHGCHPALQEIADYDIAHAINLWGECLKRQSWPSYGGRVHWAMPTSWQMTMHEQRLQEAA